MRTTVASTMAFGLAVFNLSLAQTSTVTLYIPGADPQPLEASIITSDASATTYLLQCIPGTDTDECDFDDAVTLTEGPKTAAYTYGPYTDDSGSVLLTGYADCSLDGTISAVCVESVDGSEANYPGVTTVTYTGTDMPYIPVVVTAQAAGTGSAIAASTTASTSTVTDEGSATTGSTSISGLLVAQTTVSTSSSSKSAADSLTKSTSSSGRSAAQTTASSSSVTYSETSDASTTGGAVIAGKMALLVGGIAAALAMMA